LTTKETKLPAENFSIKVNGLALTVYSEKFVRPVWGETEMKWQGLAGRNMELCHSELVEELFRCSEKFVSPVWSKTELSF
jgi:hypothetical protein